MNLTCKNPKTYSLTKDKEYEVIDENGNFITVMNDKFVAAKYSKDLFSTADNFNYTIDDYSIEFEGDYEDINIDSFNDSLISCGIGQCDELNYLLNSIDTLNFPEENRKKLINDIFDYVFEDANYAIIMFSTTSDMNAESLFDALEGYTVVSNPTYITNPNSDNQINFWAVSK